MGQGRQAGGATAPDRHHPVPAEHLCLEDAPSAPLKPGERLVITGTDHSMTACCQQNSCAQDEDGP